MEQLTADPFDAAFDYVVGNEGVIVSHHPADRGGLTKYGITQSALSAYLGRPATDAELINLSLVQAKAFYRAQYWQPLMLDGVPTPSAVALFDTTILHGYGRGVRLAQQALRLPVQDGMLGPVTHQALCVAVPADFVISFMAGIADRICAIVHSDTTQRVFLRGWFARIGRLASLI